MSFFMRWASTLFFLKWKTHCFHVSCKRLLQHKGFDCCYCGSLWQLTSGHSRGKTPHGGTDLCFHGIFKDCLNTKLLANMFGPSFAYYLSSLFPQLQSYVISSRVQMWMHACNVSHVPHVDNYISLYIPLSAWLQNLKILILTTSYCRYTWGFWERAPITATQSTIKGPHLLYLNYFTGTVFIKQLNCTQSYHHWE